MILEPKTVSQKHFKIQEINIVWCNFCAQHIREGAYLSRDPQWEVHPPCFPSKQGSDQLAKLLQLREFLSGMFAFFVLLRETRVKRRGKFGGKGRHYQNQITMVTLITLSRLSAKAHTHAYRKRVSKQRRHFNHHLFGF